MHWGISNWVSFCWTLTLLGGWGGLAEAGHPCLDTPHRGFQGLFPTHDPSKTQKYLFEFNPHQSATPQLFIYFRGCELAAPPKNNIFAAWYIVRTVYLTPQLWEQKPGWNSQQVWSDRLICLFPRCPFVSASHSQAFPLPLSQIWHYSIVIQHFLCLYPEAEVDWGNLRIAPFPCQSGCKYALGPTQPPRVLNFQQMSML